MQERVLVVDDDQAHLTMLVAMLSSWGYVVDTAMDGVLAVQQVRARPYDVVLTDVRMAHMDGIETLRQIRSYNPFLPVLIMTAYATVDTAIDALKAGAFDYLHKPLDFDQLRQGLERALDQSGLPYQKTTDTPPKVAPAGIIGTSQVMLDLFVMLEAVAPSEASVLILGESGTGKELVAQALHQGSLRSKQPLVIVNCAALAESVLESELFGHEKGAFTGAQRQREGMFVQADKGTLFLDEIGEMPLPVQAKLLRALQQGEIQRVGSDYPIQVDVRIIAATNRQLEEEVRAGKFREDLFYRLNVIALTVPPLRDRTEDIPLLAKYFLEQFSQRNHKAFHGFSPRAMDLLLRYAWPGNVRELENVVERAVILAPGDLITERDLPMGLQETGIDHFPEVEVRSLEDAERKAIMRTLAEVDNNKSAAARILGVSRVTLRNKIRKFGLED